MAHIQHDAERADEDSVNGDQRRHEDSGSLLNQKLGDERFGASRKHPWHGNVKTLIREVHSEPKADISAEDNGDGDQEVAQPALLNRIPLS